MHAAVVFPSFTRSPEARYPTAIEEIYAVAQWVGAQGTTYGLDGSRVAIAGDSAGGTMATVVAMLTKLSAVGCPSYTNFSSIPITDAGFDTPSYEQFATGFHVRRDHMRWLWDRVPARRRSAVPIHGRAARAAPEELEGLPPATVITAEADVLRDEGEAYASKLRQAGVPVTAVRYEGTIHDFVVLNALRQTNAAKAAISQAITALRDALGTDGGMSLSEPDQLGKPNVALSRRYPPPRHREPVADGREQAPNVTMDGRPWDQVVSIQRQPSASEHSCHSRVEPSKDQQQRRELVQSPELDIDNDRYPARIASRRQRARLQ